MPSPRPQPRQPTHYEPPGSMPGPHFADLKGRQGLKRLAISTPAGPPAADFGTASPCGGRPYGGPAAAARPARRTRQLISLNKVGRRKRLFLLTVETEECTTTPTTRSSGFYRRRTLPAPAVCHVAPSIARLPEESCGRLGSVIGSGSSPASWSVGSGSGPSLLSLLPDLRGRGGRARFSAAVCAPCSTRRATDRRRLR